jgi:long-subunit acyl-CoA synthetase (AMP-forming)
MYTALPFTFYFLPFAFCLFPFPFLFLFLFLSNLLVHVDPKEDVVLLPFSSGTTGLPKGVELTHYNLVSNLHQTDKNIINPELAAPGIVNLALLPFHFIYGTMLMNHTLFSGQTSVVLDTFYLKSVLKAMADFEVSYAGLTPPVLHSLATNPLVDKYSLKVSFAFSFFLFPFSFFPFSFF